MLYVFCGTDTLRIRHEAFDFVLKEEACGAIVRTLTDDQFEVGAIRGVSQSVSLWGGHECIVLDGLFIRADAKEEVITNASLLAASPQSVVVIEGKLSAEDIRELKAHAEAMHEYKAPEKDRFNVFTLADALLKRDKKSLWLLLMRAREEGLTAEEIIGTLSWQLKVARLTKVTGSAKEAGMKDFPYDKGKRGARLFSEDELQNMAQSLVLLYHEGHLGADIDLALEKWVLSV